MPKSKVIFYSLGRKRQFEVGIDVLKVVSCKLIYLGYVVTADRDHEREITR